MSVVKSEGSISHYCSAESSVFFTVTDFFFLFPVFVVVDCLKNEEQGDDDEEEDDDDESEEEETTQGKVELKVHLCSIVELTAF